MTDIAHPLRRGPGAGILRAALDNPVAECALVESAEWFAAGKALGSRTSNAETEADGSRSLAERLDEISGVV